VVVAAATEAVMSFWVGFGVGFTVGGFGVLFTLRWYLLRSFRDM